jgi:hypothetical protein
MKDTPSNIGNVKRSVAGESSKGNEIYMMMKKMND